jgi:hypothetical protein
MSLITTVTQDLINKIGAITLFGDRVAATLGGTEADPTLSQLETPYAWVVLIGSQTDSQDRERWTKVRWNFTVFIGISYGLGETDFTETQLTLLEDVCQAVTGSTVNAPGPVKWAFDGLSFAGGEASVVRYALQFSIPTFYTLST